MSTKIIGNQIDQVTRAIIEALQVTEQINLPSLNQSQVNALGTPAFGTLVYNSTEDMAQIYKQDAAQGVAGRWPDGGGCGYGSMERLPPVPGDTHGHSGPADALRSASGRIGFWRAGTVAGIRRHESGLGMADVAAPGTGHHPHR